MAEEGTDQSSSIVILSSTQPNNWWDVHHAATSSVTSWSNHNTNNGPWSYNQQKQQQLNNPSSNSSCEDQDISMSATSFTNSNSNRSGLTFESSSRRILVDQTSNSSNELMGAEQASDNHLWSHLLLGVGSSNEDVQNKQEVGENSLDTLSSKSLSSTSIFEPLSCDLLKKTSSSNNSWEFITNTSPLHNFEKHFNGFADSFIEQNERLTKLSNMVSSNWSIAPPSDIPLTCNISLNSALNKYSSTQSQADSDYEITGGGSRGSSTFLSCYGRDIKLENECRDNIEVPGGVLRKNFNGNNMGYHPAGLNNMVVGDNSNSKSYYGVLDHVSCPKVFNDVININGRLSKPLMDIQVANNNTPSFNSLRLSDSKRPGPQASSPARKGQGTTNEGKKKRTEETSSSNAVVKKPKHDNSTTASFAKVSKVKLGDKITALQQIVSPFGKTDTASVLYEAIQYIKFLQEQVQLLSNPYMKINSHKDPWGGLDRKEKDVKVDLRSKGLCLVPIACTPQACHENTGTDYWTPTYRGCLYR